MTNAMTKEQKELCNRIMIDMDKEFCKKIDDCANCPCLILGRGCIRDFFCIVLMDDEGNSDECRKVLYNSRNNVS